jgi:putative heme-binding domain-containing protein
VKLRPGIDNRDSIGGANDQLDLNFAGELFRVYCGSNGGDVLIAKKKIIAGLWTHVAATRDAAGRFKIYLNGELDSTSAKSASHPIEKFLIGWSTPQGGTEGQFAEYRIWNRERSAAEIRNFFDRSLPAGDAGLLYNGSNDKGWGAANKAATLTRTLDLPPVMSLSQATEFDKTYEHYLSLMKAGGSVESGKALAAMCSACHQFGNTGGNIGPNLSSVGAMGPEAIVRNILTPNAAIEPGYRIFRVTLKDGSLLDAFFVSEDKDAIVVRQMGAGDKRIERKNIVSTQFLRQSLMPEGLLASFTDQQRKDLFAYLMSLK